MLFSGETPSLSFKAIRDIRLQESFKAIRVFQGYKNLLFALKEENVYHQGCILYKCY